MARMEKQTIFFVDDDPHIFRSVRKIIETNGFTVNCFEGVHSCLEELRDQKCDLLVTEIMMPGMDGIDLLREAKRMKPWLPVLIVTGHGDVPMTVRAFKAGAAGLIEKPLKEQEFLAAVMDAFDPMTSGNRLLGRPLTPTEMKVLHLILAAYSSKEISHLLYRSIRTIEVHRRHIMGKLGVDNIVDLVKRSVQMGLAGVGAPRTASPAASSSGVVMGLAGVGTPRTAAEEPTDRHSRPKTGIS